MNRLWVRLSMFYAVVLVLVMLVLIALVFGGSDRPPDIQALQDAGLEARHIDAIIMLDEDGLLEQFVRTLMSVQLIAFSIAAIIAGTLGSILISYRLTRPLTKLEEAARKVGDQDLSYRVTSTGSDEMVALADSFNSMAEALESAEKRRQNLLADVSHELRTPLTVLQGNLRGALDGVSELDKPQIATLYDQTRQLNHLIKDLHDLAQAEANRLQLDLSTLDMGELIGQAGELFSPLAATNNIVIEVDKPAQLPSIQGDRTRMMQVLHNLISNAMRYAKSEIRLSLSVSAESISLTVADDGIGMEPEHVAHIFDRFYRADSSRTRQTGGTGLGLAIVRSIVNGHGGSIVAESEPNAGTTFTILLPT